MYGGQKQGDKNDGKQQNHYNTMLFFIYKPETGVKDSVKDFENICPHDPPRKQDYKPEVGVKGLCLEDSGRRSHCPCRKQAYPAENPHPTEDLVSLVRYYSPNLESRPRSLSRLPDLYLD